MAGMKIPKFSLRNLFLAVLFCAFVISFEVKQWRMDNLLEFYRKFYGVEKLDTLRTAIEQEGYSVEWDENRKAYRLKKLQTTDEQPNK
jgi:hypothetical protein